MLYRFPVPFRPALPGDINSAIYLLFSDETSPTYSASICRIDDITFLTGDCLAIDNWSRGPILFFNPGYFL